MHDGRQKGLSREDVFHCAEKMIREGKNPTITGIREQLGTGSLTTIQKYLALWKRENPEAGTEAPLEFPGVTRAVREEIAKAIKSAQDAYRQEKATMEKEATEWREEIERLQEDRERLEKKLQETLADKNATEGRLEGRTEELLQEIGRLREELETERREKIEAKEQAAELRGRLAQLQGKEAEKTGKKETTAPSPRGTTPSRAGKAKTSARREK